MNINDYLSTETYDLLDSWSGKPIGSYRLLRNMPSDMFNQNRHKMFCISVGIWGYLDKVITRDECVKLYGEITHEEFGPRGGWKSITFGTTKFISDYLRP